MQPALRLIPAPSLKLHPEDLCESLERSFHTLDALVAELHCSLDDLEETLEAPETSALLKNKTRLACLQVQLIALRAAPHCAARLVALTNETEKPEVARRATTTLLHIAGIATYTKAQEPAPPPVHQPTPDRTPEEPHEMTDEDLELIESTIFVRELRKTCNIDLTKIDTSNPDPVIAALRPFLKPAQEPDPDHPTPTRPLSS